LDVTTEAEFLTGTQNNQRLTQTGLTTRDVYFVTDPPGYQTSEPDHTRVGFVSRPNHFAEGIKLSTGYPDWGAMHIDQVPTMLPLAGQDEHQGRRSFKSPHSLLG